MAKPKAKSERSRGQPPKYKSEKELQDKLLAYFLDCTEKKLMANKAGVCVFLGISRETYNVYKKKYPDAIKGAEDVIEQAWVQRLAGPNATGAIFYLKAAMGWKDQQHVDVTTAGKELTITGMTIAKDGN